uniref:General secretion pathway protein M n=1 Tax=uncultured organism TaxID=155900 RepID=M1PR30_9ZZZZ|nr:hypothetical protein FLSS-16_0016 [uncultured organism]
MNYISSSNRKWIYLAAAVLVAVLIYQWGLSPVLSYKKELVQRQEEAQERLQELKKLEKRYVQAQKSSDKSDSLDQKDPNFTLFSYLEEQASKNGIKDNIEFMRPSSENLSSGVTERQVELRIGNVSLDKLTEFLKQIEFAPETIFVKRLTIRSPEKNPGNLQVNSIIVTYR